MTPEKRKKTTKLLSLAVMSAAFLVFIGWFFDIGVLKSISPAWVSMKITTAIAFVLSAIILYFIARAVEGDFDIAQVALSITSLLIILLMGTLFFSAVLEIRTGVEELFIKETAAAPMSVIPGRPSIPTMLNFLLIAGAGILTTLNPANLRMKLKVIGIIIGFVGLIAVIGYIINMPVLYYYVEGINTALACHTAALFMVIGIGFLCL